MLKKRLSLLLVLLAVALVLPMSACGKPDEARTRYEIEAEFFADTMTLDGKMEVAYRNKEDVPLENLCFHLYGNAYRQDAKFQPVSASASADAYPNGKNVFGQTDVKSVTQDGEESAFEVGGEDRNILIVPLKKEIYPDETAELCIEFELKLSNIHHRLGYGDDTVNFGNWYPIACVYENGKFVTDPYYSNGDPFYSEVSDYEVTVTAPKDFVCAFGGDLVEKSGDSLVTYKVKAERVRDFAMVFSTRFQILSDYVDGNGTRVDYYYYDDVQAAENLALAIKAIKTFNKLFGKYPYDTYTVVKADFCHGGMEYPRLVYISDNVTGEDYQTTIVHETAHQWWYGLVGNNQVAEGYLDEGLAEYSTALFYENNPEYNLDRKYFVDSANSSYKLFERVIAEVTGKFDSSMNRSLGEYKSEYEYIVMTYRKGMILFDELRTAVGDDAFFKGIRKYFSRNEYKNATLADFIGAMSVNADVSGFINSFVSGKAIL